MATHPSTQPGLIEFDEFLKSEDTRLRRYGKGNESMRCFRVGVNTIKI